MRVAFAVAVLMVTINPAAVRSDPPATAAGTAARWAETEAQSRITNGDYDGAIQAEHEAQADRQEAERETAGRSPKR
jgi:hypothetical protein